jgi:2-dehydro-3-deoxygluconokinase
MVHSNPLLRGESPQKFITIGEIMLRSDPAQL